MKKLILFLCLIPLVVFAAPVAKTKVSLVGHVTSRINGDAVVVDGYKFYVTTISGTFASTPNITVPESTETIEASLTTLIPPPAKGTYYVMATSYKASEESYRSNEVVVYAAGDGTFFPQAPLGVPGVLQLQ